MRVHHETWAQQLKDAMNVNGGDVENASTVIYYLPKKTPQLGAEGSTKFAGNSSYEMLQR